MMGTGNGEYSTPQWLFDKLDSIFNFTVDLCATKKNAKCEKYYSRLKKNSFKKKWSGVGWCNPPYGSPQNPCASNCSKKTCEKRGFHLDEYWPGIIDWVERGVKQTQKHRSTVVFLAPARTETEWFNVVWNHATAICFVSGRLNFNEHDQKLTTAPFPSVIFVFGERLNRKQQKVLTQIGPVLTEWETGKG